MTAHCDRIEGKNRNRKSLHVLLAAALLITALGSACVPATLDCTSEKVFCVGLVTDVGKVNDKSFNQSAWEGLSQAHTQLGTQIEYIETTNPRDFGKNIAAFGDLGYDVIVTVGSDMREATLAAASTYPDTDFIGVDQFQDEPVDRVAGLIFPEDQAGFLAGALAALMSKSHKVGAVCATNGVPAIWRYGEGYKAGAAYIDEQNDLSTDVYVLYHADDDQAFSDAEWGTQTAGAIIDQGADIVLGCGGLTGESGMVAAARTGASVIGLDTDRYLTLPDAAPRMLSSALQLIKPGLFELIQLSQQGRFPGGNYLGHVGYAPFHDLDNEVPAEVRAQLEEIAAGLADGSLKTNVPFAKPES